MQNLSKITNQVASLKPSRIHQESPISANREIRAASDAAEWQGECEWRAEGRAEQVAQRAARSSLTETERSRAIEVTSLAQHEPHRSERRRTAASSRRSAPFFWTGLPSGTPLATRALSTFWLFTYFRILLFSLAAVLSLLLTFWTLITLLDLCYFINNSQKSLPPLRISF